MVDGIDNNPWLRVEDVCILQIDLSPTAYNAG